MTSPRGREPSALERLRALEELDRQQRQPDPRDLPPPDAGGRGKGVAIGVLGGIGLLLFKFKGVLLLLLGKLKYLLVGVKLLKLGSLVKTGSTMLLMIWVYAQFYGWLFAAGFVVLILVHELGHGLAARLVGLRAGAPVFIPFFGAFIALKDQPRSTYQDFLIGAGGPLAGTAGAIACLAFSSDVPDSFGGLLRAVGYFTLIINLFNLLPVWSLDGARMTRPLNSRLWLLGSVGLALVVFQLSGMTDHLNPTSLILLLVVMARTGMTWWQERRERLPQAQAGALERLSALEQQRQQPEEATVTPRQRRIAAAVYFGLAALLIALIQLVWGSLPQIPR